MSKKMAIQASRTGPNFIKLNGGSLSPCKIKTFDELHQPNQTKVDQQSTQDWQRRFQAYRCENRPVVCSTFWNYVRVQKAQKPLNELLESINYFDDLLIEGLTDALGPETKRAEVIRAKNKLLYQSIKPMVDHGNDIILELNDPKISDEVKLELFSQLIQIKKTIIRKLDEAGVSSTDIESTLNTILIHTTRPTYSVVLSDNSPRMLWAFFTGMTIFFMSGAQSPINRVQNQQIENRFILEDYRISIREYLKELIGKGLMTRPVPKNYPDENLNNTIMVLGIIANLRLKQCQESEKPKSPAETNRTSTNHR